METWTFIHFYFESRLAPLGLTVKELTGDMQLTKTEIMQTQVLVVSKVLFQKVFYVQVTSLLHSKFALIF